MFKMFYRLIFK